MTRVVRKALIHLLTARKFYIIRENIKTVLGEGEEVSCSKRGNIENFSITWQVLRKLKPLGSVDNFIINGLLGGRRRNNKRLCLPRAEISRPEKIKLAYSHHPPEICRPSSPSSLFHRKFFKF